MKRTIVLSILVLALSTIAFADDWIDMGSGTAPRTRDVVTELRTSTPVVTVSGDTTSVAISDLGKLFVADTIAAKAQRTLPAAVAGREVQFYVSDTDSLLITTASGDSLLSGATKLKTTTSVAGTIKLHAIDAKFWIFEYTTGTWTSY